MFWDTAKKMMKTRGLTQRDLSRITGKTPSSVNRWYNADVLPQVDSAYQIAKALGTTIEDLIEGNEKPKNQAMVKFRYDDNFKKTMEKLASLDEKSFLKISGMVDLLCSEQMQDESRKGQNAG